MCQDMGDLGWQTAASIQNPASRINVKVLNVSMLSSISLALIDPWLKGIGNHEPRLP